MQNIWLLPSYLLRIWSSIVLLLGQHTMISCTSMVRDHRSRHNFKCNKTWHAHCMLQLIDTSIKLHKIKWMINIKFKINSMTSFWILRRDPEHCHLRETKIPCPFLPLFHPSSTAAWLLQPLLPVRVGAPGYKTAATERGEGGAEGKRGRHNREERRKRVGAPGSQGSKRIDPSSHMMT